MQWFVGWLDAGLAFDADPVVTHGPTIAALSYQGCACDRVVLR
jgi:hypothetical protein